MKKMDTGRVKNTSMELIAWFKARQIPPNFAFALMSNMCVVMCKDRSTAVDWLDQMRAVVDERYPAEPQ